MKAAISFRLYEIVSTKLCILNSVFGTVISMKKEDEVYTNWKKKTKNLMIPLPFFFLGGKDKEILNVDVFMLLNNFDSILY